MRAFLEQDEFGNYFDSFVYITKYELLDRGIEIVDFIGGGVNKDLVHKSPTNKDICVGSVQACRKFFELIGVDTPKYLGYPEELDKYYLRKIWSSTFKDISWYPIFIKPRNDVKLFTGMVIDTSKDHLFVSDYYPEITPDLEIYCSDVLEFASEYRCFISKGELKGIHWYSGDFKITLDSGMIKIIEKMIKDYKSAPTAYTLDVGIIENDVNELALIEINDFWAIGSYGMDAKIYTRMTIDRMEEIKRMK